MKTVYVAALYTRRLRRRFFGLWGERIVQLELVGVSMLSDAGALTIYDYDRPRRDEDILYLNHPLIRIPGTPDSYDWDFHKAMAARVRDFILPDDRDAPCRVVTDGDPNIVYLVDSLLREVRTQGYPGLEYHSTSQTISQAVGWLPSQVYGITSNFTIAYPLKEVGGYSEADRWEMFRSHIMYPRKVNSITLEDLCLAIMAEYKAVNDIMRTEIELLAFSGTDTPQEVQE